MSNKEIIGKSLFQVNLLLLASWDSSSMMVNPIFYNAGYRVIVIEQLLKVPDVIYSDLTSKNINIQKSSRPEFILEHQDNKLYLSIECKKSWFSIESSTSRQAFSMLLISGDIINNALGKTGSLPWENQVTYVSSEGQGSKLWSTLDEISDSLKRQGIIPAAVTTLELSWKPKGIYITHIPASVSIPNVSLNGNGNVPVMKLESGEEPVFLYLLPYLPEENIDTDPQGKMQLQERIRLALMELVGQLDGKEKIYTFDELLDSTIPVWNLWKNSETKKCIKKYVRQFLTEEFHELTLYDTHWVVGKQSIRIPPMKNSVLSEIRKHFLKQNYRRRPIQLTGYIQSGFDD